MVTLFLFPDIANIGDGNFYMMLVHFTDSTTSSHHQGTNLGKFKDF